MAHLVRSYNPNLDTSSVSIQKDVMALLGGLRAEEVAQRQKVCSVSLHRLV